MKDLDFRYLCRTMGNLSGIPIRLYSGDQELLFHFASPLPVDPMRLYREAIWAITGNVGYYMTDDLSFYGLVRSGDRRIVIGPTRQIPNTPQELAFRLDLPQSEAQPFSTE